MQKDVWLYSWDDEYFASDEYESKEEAIRRPRKNLEGLGRSVDWFTLGKKKKLIYLI